MLAPGVVVSILLLLSGVLAQTPSRAPEQTTREGASPASDSPSSISGHVVDSETGVPLTNALVVASTTATAQDPEFTTTDRDGRYQFDSLAPGRYSLRAEKLGYVALAYGQRRPREPARTVELSAGQALDDVDFDLPEAGVIAVRVVDEIGEPVRNVAVTVLEYRFSTQGERRLLYAGNRIPSGRTNDLGIVRVWGLPAGEYYVRASPGVTGSLSTPPTPDGSRYAETYYAGGLSELEALPVFLGRGDEVHVDLPLLVSGPPIRIAGTVRASDGTVPTAIAVSVSGQTVPVQADGTFVARSVRPAREHMIFVRPTPVDRPDGEFATVRVDGGMGDVHVAITTSKPQTVRGRFVADERATSKLRGRALELFATPIDAALALPADYRGSVDGTFEIRRLLGSYVFRLRATPDWSLKAVLLDGRDVTDVPLDVSASPIEFLEVLVTQRSTEVTGQVVQASGAPAADCFGILFPENRSGWTSYSRFIAAARCDARGEFEIVGLPQGRYRAAAVSALQPGQERNAVLLDRLLGASAVVDVVEDEPTSVRVALSDF